MVLRTIGRFASNVVKLPIPVTGAIAQTAKDVVGTLIGDPLHWTFNRFKKKENRIPTRGLFPRIGSTVSSIANIPAGLFNVHDPVKTSWSKDMERRKNSWGIEGGTSKEPWIISKTASAIKELFMWSPKAAAA